MTLDDIFNDLKYGELSGHGMFMSELTEQDKLKLIAHINIGLTDLYTRFPLLTREVTVIQVMGRTLYILDKTNVVKTMSEVSYDKYIIDADEYPFINDIVKITGVYDEIGNEVRMNDWTACPVVTTPAYNVLEIPQPVDTNALFVTYQAKHHIVSLTANTIDLPAHLKPALLAYVAHRVYSGGTAQEHVNLANLLYQKYELFCAQILDRGAENSIDYDTNIKPCLGGWV